MPRFRFTISRWMAATAVLGLNIGWVRNYLLVETSGEPAFLLPLDFGFLIFFALQLALWRYLSTEGRRRRFWLGFAASGLAATLALWVSFEATIDLHNWYTGAASDLAYFCLPSRLDVMLSNEHWDWFLAIIYFLPELLAAAFGGLLAVCLSKRSVDSVCEIRTATAVRASSAV